MKEVNRYVPFWNVIPGKGLGPIAFDMSKSAIEPFYEQLGGIVAEKDVSASTVRNDLLDTFELLKDFLTQEDMNAALQGLNDFGGHAENAVIVYTHSGISLTFEYDRLVEIFADDRASQLHFLGTPVFSSNPKNLIILIQRELKEYPCIQHLELAFPLHHMFLYSFVEESESVGYISTDPKEKTLCWRSSPRVNGVDLSSYRKLDQHDS